MQTQVQDLVNIVRKGAWQQTERIQAVSELSQILDSAELAQAGANMRQISVQEADFVTFKRLQEQEASMWAVLNQALVDAGHPPAATLDEVLNNIPGKTTPQQIGEWYGAEVVTYAEQHLDLENIQYFMWPLIEALGWINDTQAIPIILDALNHVDPQVRQRAVIASGTYNAPELHEKVLALLKTETDFNVVASIPLGLRSTEDETIIKFLADWVQTHENGNLRANAAHVLSQMERFELLFELVAALKGDVKQAAVIQALGESSHETAFNALIGYVGINDYRLQMRSIQALQGTTDERAFDPFCHALLTGSYSVRKAAIQALIPYGNRCIAYLVQVLDHVELPSYAQKKPHMYKTVGETAKIALEAMGTPAALDAAAQWKPPPKKNLSSE